MKLIVAIIRPEKLEAVRTALNSQQASLMCVSQVVGYGGEHDARGMYRGREVQVRPPKLRLEMAVEDRHAEGVVAAIAHAGETGAAGQPEDGKILVLPLGECVSIGAATPVPVTAGTWRGHRYQLR